MHEKESIWTRLRTDPVRPTTSPVQPRTRRWHVSLDEAEEPRTCLSERKRPQRCTDAAFDLIGFERPVRADASSAPHEGHPYGTTLAASKVVGMAFKQLWQPSSIARLWTGQPIIRDADISLRDSREKDTQRSSEGLTSNRRRFARSDPRQHQCVAGR